MSNQSDQQTVNGQMNEEIGNPSSDSTTGNVPSGTGAIKKTNNAQSRYNRNKSCKNGNRHKNYESTHNKWRYHNRNYGPQNCSPEGENMTYNISEDSKYKSYQKNDNYNSRELRYSSSNENRTENSYRNSNWQHYYGEKNSQHFDQISEQGTSSKFNKNGSIRNFQTQEENILHRSTNASNRNGQFSDNDRNSIYEESSNIHKFNKKRHKNGVDKTRRYYNEERVYEDYYVPKFDKNGRYYNGWDKKSQLYNERPSMVNSDVGRSNMNQKNYGRNMFSNPKKARNSVKELKNSKQKLKNEVEIASQRERLEAMIKQRTLECLVCCELLKHNNEIWTCKQCYHILHLKCIQAWAKSSKIENGWRCPACQNVCKEIPNEYLCFCGKVKNPRNEPGFIAHSCGEVCLKNGRNCDHRCSILCHPGPCPDCTILVDKSCGCGKTKQQVMCSSEVDIICSNQCQKILKCKIHKCSEQCHIGDCKPCEKILQQICYCGKENREIICTFELQGNTNYPCEATCDKILSCGNHKCQERCHSGVCKPCSRDCSLIKTCFCGKNPLKIPRTSCMDPIPSCGLLCQKSLKCGPNGARHKCEFACHDGECPACSLTTVMKCRCGSMSKEVACQKLISDDGKCERKCNKKRFCGKHKCNQRCCIEIEHICPLPCNRSLSCGNHRCELTCHSGRCKPCIETSFEELYCECGSSVRYPPIPCGTKPPICDKPCSRPRECGHDVNHACHTGPCPPCTILCKKWCYGKHEQRGTIPCHQEEFSCGLPCGKPMLCGRHKCSSTCHLGTCPIPCKQPCLFERQLCGHPCLAPCHELPCPKTTCKSKIAVSCICGVQKGIRSCNEVANEMRSIELAQLGEKILNMSKNQSVDMTDMGKPKRPEVLKILECTEECRVIERNRRLAIGLQIRNPDISQKLTPRYSDFMKGWAKKDPHFCQKIHNKLTELVKLAQESQQKCRYHSFESMNRDKRQFVHEYCEHFGCESEAYDSEPNRNVVATALRNKSWLPSMSLLEVIQRENGQRKVPMPSQFERNMCSKSESVMLKPLGKSVRLGLQVNVDNPKK